MIPLTVSGENTRLTHGTARGRERWSRVVPSPHLVIDTIRMDHVDDPMIVRKGWFFFPDCLERITSQ